MDFSGYIVGLAKDFSSKKWHITLSMDEDTALETIQGFGQTTKLAIHIAKWRKKRSLDANAYLWVLCTKLAHAMQSTKEEIYEQMLQRYSLPYKDDDGYVVIAMNKKVDVSKLEGHWQFYKPHPDDPNTVYYYMIKGSSMMDSKEMSDLLNGVVDECRKQGIETETDKQHQAMIEEWGKQYAKAREHHN